MKKWEYKRVHKVLSTTELNQLGEEGWELIWVNTDTYTYLFKREKDDNDIILS